MSYRIEYQYHAFLERGCNFKDGQDRFVVAAEGGDNNLYEGNTNRRVRSWSVCALGTKVQVLKRMVYFAGACEGGSLKPHGRDSTPETYIRKIRRLLAEADGIEHRGHESWAPRIQLSEGHAATKYLRDLGIAHQGISGYGTPLTEFTLREVEKNLVFDLVDRFPDVAGWNLATVYGLRNS